MLKENTLCTITLRRSQHYYQLSEIRAIHVRFFQPSVEYYNGSDPFLSHDIFSSISQPQNFTFYLPTNCNFMLRPVSLADLITESIYAFRRHPNPFWFDYHVPTYSLAILNCLAGLVAWPSPVHPLLFKLLFGFPFSARQQFTVWMNYITLCLDGQGGKG